MERIRSLIKGILLVCFALLTAATPQDSSSKEPTRQLNPRPANSNAPGTLQEVNCGEIQNRIIAHCRSIALTDRETAFVLALCEVESGFDPQAKNPHSSACGLFQFIRSTRQELARRAGVCVDDPYCIEMQFACLTEQLKEMFPSAEGKAGRRGTDEFFAWAYAYHHDGPSYNSGGYALAQRRVLPRLPHYERMVKGR